jgi:predicted RNase H-like HicB family nuclease
MEYTAIIEKTTSGWYIGQCEQVPGAMTQGKTIAEVKENLKEAITLVLEAEKELCINRYRSDGIRFIRRKIAML